MRIPVLADVEVMFSASRYKGFTDGMLWDPPNAKEELIEPVKSTIAAWKNGEAYGFMIENKEGNATIGRISIRPSKKPKRWNVGFWIHPEFQNKGYMKEALKSALEFGFTKLEAIAIEAEYAVWNKASEKVLQNCGMQYESYKEKAFQKHGNWIAENTAVITKAEWINKN